MRTCCGWRAISRDRFKEFMKSHEPAIVVLEACDSAHYWAETLGDMGHDVKLIAPQYVKPFVKRQKNDAADAEAIVVADEGIVNGALEAYESPVPPANVFQPANEYPLLVGTVADKFAVSPAPRVSAVGAPVPPLAL